jgi:ABC-type multidrug transport system permease subunit
MKINVIITKIILPAFLTALGFLMVDYLIGGFEEKNILLHFIIILVVTHLMMYGIARRNYIKKQE